MFKKKQDIIGIINYRSFRDDKLTSDTYVVSLLEHKDIFFNKSFEFTSDQIRELRDKLNKLCIK